MIPTPLGPKKVKEVIGALQQANVNDILASIRVGVCNADDCETRTEINDVFCVDDFRRLPKPLRDELRQAREVVRRNGGRARVNAEAAYKMRIVGARLWLKKNASG